MKISVVRSKSDGRYIRHFGVPTDDLNNARLFTQEQLRQYKKYWRRQIGPSAFDENFEAVEVLITLKPHP